MSDEALDPLLRQFAEKRLGRPLAPGEEQALLEQLPRKTARQPAPAAGSAAHAPRPAPAANPPLPQLKTRREAREQVKHFLQLNQQKAYEKMRGILQTIDAQNETTLGMLDTEQRKVAGILDEREPQDGPHASGAAEIQDSTRQALMMIGEQLTGLIRQEIEACFRQYVDPLAARLDAIHDWLQGLSVYLTEPAEPAEPDATTTAATTPAHDVASAAVHDTRDQASME
ncbi:hypothetical protein C5O80_21340 [Burkholderia sp. SRS-46]|nr:hypothetical protein C5O80_21340 [Burkholderia sp. SRS-46]